MFIEAKDDGRWWWQLKL